MPGDRVARFTACGGAYTNGIPFFDWETLLWQGASSCSQARAVLGCPGSMPQLHSVRLSWLSFWICITRHSEDDSCGLSEAWWTPLFLLELLTARIGGYISKQEGIFSAIEGEMQSSTLDRVNGAGWRYSWNWWEKKGCKGCGTHRVIRIVMLSETFCPSWTNSEVHGPMELHKMVLHVVQSKYLYHELFYWPVWMPCRILLCKRSPEQCGNQEEDSDM